MRDDPELIS